MFDHVWIKWWIMKVYLCPSAHYRSMALNFFMSGYIPHIHMGFDWGISSHWKMKISTVENTFFPSRFWIKCLKRSPTPSTRVWSLDPQYLATVLTRRPMPMWSHSLFPSEFFSSGWLLGEWVPTLIPASWMRCWFCSEKRSDLKELPSQKIIN